jgi:hypothetical protein
MVLGAGCWVLGARCSVHGAGYKVQGARYKVKGERCKVLSAKSTEQKQNKRIDPKLSSAKPIEIFGLYVRFSLF